MAITDFLFPQGNFLNIRSNAPNQRSYNIGATEDLVRNLPGGFLKDLISPAAAATLSLPYDTIQGIGRAVDQSNIGTAPYRGIVDDTEIPKGPSLSDIGRAIDAENPLSSAIERTIGASGPLAERISNISNPFKMSQAAASEVDLSNRNINTTEPYQDKIMGGLEGDLDPYNFNRRFEESYTEPVGVPGMDKKAINYTDAPVRLMMRKNNPNRGIIDNLILSRGNPDASLVNRTKNVGKKGFNIGKQALLSGLGFATGIPLGILGMLPEMDPRQKALREVYGYDNIGRVPQGQLMAGYNPVSGGLLNMLTGGKMGEETTYGLSGAIDKRIARINKTLAKQRKDKKRQESEVLKQRLKDLQALKDREAKALADARAKQSANLESQRRGRRPGSGGGGEGRQDSGGPTGGYSYDSGGREGFGYGL